MITDEFLERVAVGLFALRRPVFEPLSAKDRFRALDDRDKERFRADARFVLSYADDTVPNMARGRDAV